MNVEDFISKILTYEKMPTIYKLGKFMNSYRQGVNGKYLECDCSGLIRVRYGAILTMASMKIYILM